MPRKILTSSPTRLMLKECGEIFCYLEALQPMLPALTRLQELINDTAVAAESEAYTAALEVYRYAKANGTVAGLANLVNEMG